MSRLITNAIRSTSASADAITLDGSGNATFPANVTCSGTATGFGGGKIVGFGLQSHTTEQYAQQSSYALVGTALTYTATSASNK